MLKKKRLSMKLKRSKSKAKKSGDTKQYTFRQATLTDFFPTQHAPHRSDTGVLLHSAKRTLATPETKSKKRNVTSSNKKKTPKKLSELFLNSHTPSLGIGGVDTPCKPLKSSKKRILFEVNTNTQLEEYSMNESTDIFNDIDLDQLYVYNESDDCSLITNNRGLHQLPRIFIVKKVTKQKLLTSDTGSSWLEEQLLQLISDNSTYECCLRDIWSQSDIRAGDVIHLLGDLFNYNIPLHVISCQGKRQIVISEDTNAAIIVNPDYLVSSTSIASAGITCTRRAVLAEIYKGGSSPTNEFLLYGHLLHILFQKFIAYCSSNHGNNTPVSVHEGLILQEYITNLTSDASTLEQMYALHLTEREVMDKLESFIPSIIDWCHQYIHNCRQTTRMEVRKFWKQSDTHTKTSVDVHVSSVRDIEENVWSPRFGLKGKVDATVHIRVNLANDDTVFEGVSPLEVKTGKMTSQSGSIEHRAQVMLYCLMLSDIHVTDVPTGVLYYMKESHTQLIPTATNEIKALLIARNHLARYHGNHWDHVTLPEMINDRFICQHCPLLKQCTLHHRVFEDGSVSSTGLGHHYPSSVKEIASSHSRFFKHWFELLMEEMTYCQEETVKDHTIWGKSLTEREESGNCIGNVIAGRVLTPPTEHSQGFWIQQEFERDCPLAYPCSLNVGDRIVISIQDSHCKGGVVYNQWGVAMGYITELNQENTHIILRIEKPITDLDKLYCIDLRVMAVGDGVGVANLADLCSSDSERDYRLRQLIIDQVKPVYKTSYTCTDTVQEIMQHLSDHQKEVIHKVLLANDYSLVLGMPGTGKTSTITQLVRILVSMGKRVLITSFTNSAVDNILLRLYNEGVEFVRVGSKVKVHPLIVPFTTGKLSKNAGNVAKLRDMYDSKLVVACTCHGINHVLFTHRYFDYCIIDEAGQIPLPLSLGPLRLANVFILVGDHYQLPPLVTSPKAKAGGYDVSLFKLLSEAQPQTLISLSRQYRMNQAIMDICNTLIYDGQLQCASEQVAVASLNIPEWDLASSEIQSPWLMTAINPSIPVCLLDTSKCEDSYEQRTTGRIITNQFEAEKVCIMVRTLVKLGVQPDDILIITQYRHQQRLILKVLGNESIEVLTVDKCQGRDRSCVILSFVRNNQDKRVGHLLSNWQRINVALTRAKHKLIMIGCVTTLSNSECLKKLITLLQEQSKIIDITEST